MTQFFRKRTLSLSMVVLVMLGILIVQSTISYSTTYGALAKFVQKLDSTGLPEGGLVLRALLAMLLVILWLLNRRRALFKAIIVVNGFLTLGLFMNLASLITVLFGLTPQVVRVLLLDVVLMAISNILIFSIWYWIVDPPGVEEVPREDEAWDFLDEYAEALDIRTAELLESMPNPMPYHPMTRLGTLTKQQRIDNRAAQAAARQIMGDGKVVVDFVYV